MYFSVLNELKLNKINKPVRVLYIEAYPGMKFAKFNQRKLSTSGNFISKCKLCLNFS